MLFGMEEEILEVPIANLLIELTTQTSKTEKHTKLEQPVESRM